MLLYFLYTRILDELCTFVQLVLPKLPFFRSYTTLNDECAIFRTYDGVVLDPPRLATIFRRALLSMGIKYTGSITDLRRASVTLTGKYCPDKHELMSLFLGHSRKVHDKHYRIQLGHTGLFKAFQVLEAVQSNDIAQPDLSIFTNGQESLKLSGSSFDVSNE